MLVETERLIVMSVTEPVRFSKEELQIIALTLMYAKYGDLTYEEIINVVENYEQVIREECDLRANKS